MAAKERELVEQEQELKTLRTEVSALQYGREDILKVSTLQYGTKELEELNTKEVSTLQYGRSQSRGDGNGDGYLCQGGGLAGSLQA